ncbi:hypothetical protein GCM10010381_65600 [Streptomyces xantholiticus]|nr:hypothetical protein GCM10010381_65600 [Streptomyces xantholiticus]
MVRSGPVVREVGAVVAECGAAAVHMAAGVTRYAHRREELLRQALGERGVALRVHDAVITAVAPGTVTPAGSDHYAVFTPYFRRWSRERLRETCPARALCASPTRCAASRSLSRRAVRSLAGPSLRRRDGGP